ncbi:hypothetical protein [Streptomyces sp. NPDC049099]|uniref:hypothetical protein n=1 Tax=unclassified Streptomyces TaxID=2593676 RepID=UPI003444FEEB
MNFRNKYRSLLMVPVLAAVALGLGCSHPTTGPTADRSVSAAALDHTGWGG